MCFSAGDWQSRALWTCRTQNGLRCFYSVPFVYVFPCLLNNLSLSCSNAFTLRVPQWRSHNRRIHLFAEEFNFKMCAHFRTLHRQVGIDDALLHGVAISARRDPADNPPTLFADGFLAQGDHPVLGYLLAGSIR